LVTSRAIILTKIEAYFSTAPTFYQRSRRRLDFDLGRGCGFDRGEFTGINSPASSIYFRTLKFYSSRSGHDDVATSKLTGPGQETTNDQK
jgi:hypothetical protein